MTISKGAIVRINHTRKGSFCAQATESFDTEKEVFWPLRVAQMEGIDGLNNSWELGDEIPCRGEFVKHFEVLE
jgi:hypothetical protein